jgi:hypothetical protein
MDPITLRSLERILAVLIGGVSIVLGYRLFLAVPEQRDGSGTVRLPSLHGDSAVLVTNEPTGGSRTGVPSQRVPIVSVDL